MVLKIKVPERKDETMLIQEADLCEGIDINDVVWSVFQRKRSNKGDGNPFIYALKGEKKWHFKSKEDREQIEAQINTIVEKFLKDKSYNVTILIPSSSDVNNYLANVVLSKSSDIQRIDGLLRKISTQEAEDYALADDSAFREFYLTNGSEQQFNYAMEDLRLDLERMNKLKHGIFTRHLLRDDDMRNVMDKTFALNDDPDNTFAPKINGMDLLIIDDTISRGHSVNEAVSRLKQCYAPKSITGLTLLSKLD